MVAVFHNVLVDYPDDLVADLPDPVEGGQAEVVGCYTFAATVGLLDAKMWQRM